MPKDKMISEAEPPKRQIRRFHTDDAVSGLSEMSLNKRRLIIETAFDCFLEYGYEGTTIKEVAARSGVIKQTVYSHFADKDALFRTVIKVATFDHVNSKLQDSKLVNMPIREVLQTIAKVLIFRTQEPRFAKFFRMMIGETGRFPELAKMFVDVTHRPFQEMIVRRIKEQNELCIPDPEAFTRVYTGAITHHCMQQFVLGCRDFAPFSDEQLLNELMRIVDMHRIKPHESDGE